MLAIIQTHYDSDKYPKYGPRKIYLHTWSYITDRISAIDWVLKTIGHNDKIIPYLITTRLDDDDALNRKFVKILQHEFQKQHEKNNSFRLRYYSYNTGYYMNIDRHHIMKKKVNMIAIGLSLMARLEYYPVSVYLGDHTKIPLYLRHPEYRPDLNRFYKACHDLPVNPEQVRRRLKVIPTTEPMWIRTIHNYNLQHNIQQIPVSIGMKSSSQENLTFLGKYFNLRLKPLSQEIQKSTLSNKHKQSKPKKLSKPRIKYLGHQK